MKRYINTTQPIHTLMPCGYTFCWHGNSRWALVSGKVSRVSPSHLPDSAQGNLKGNGPIDESQARSLPSPLPSSKSIYSPHRAPANVSWLSWADISLEQLMKALSHVSVLLSGGLLSKCIISKCVSTYPSHIASCTVYFKDGLHPYRCYRV